MIDLYCERIGPEFWAEPFNALSNLAFLLAFAFILPMVKRQWCVLTGPTKAVTVGLLALLLAIFVGSSAFHTLATRQALLADVIPISLFQLVFLASYLGFVARVKLPWLVAIITLFLVSAPLAEQLPVDLNGSNGYLPPLVFVGGLAVYHYHSRQPAPWALAGAWALFAVSVTLRTLDNAWCSVWPMGTHFLWHILNGAVLYLCLVAWLCAQPVRGLSQVVEN